MVIWKNKSNNQLPNSNNQTNSNDQITNVLNSILVIRILNIDYCLEFGYW